MRITELLKRESIGLDVAADSKEEAIDKLVSLMDAGGRLNDKAGYKEGILAREALGSTAIGEGIAIPHAKVEAVKEPGLAAMVVRDGVDYEAFDGSLAHLLFMIAAPAGGADVHLEALSRLSTLLMNPGFKENLIAAKDKDEFLKIIDEAEVARFGAPEGADAGKDGQASDDLVGNGQTDGESAGKGNASGGMGGDAKASGGLGGNAKASGGYRVLAVTACPTGIAHTYMAAENLENTGKKLGIPLKAETDGSGGAQNVLTREEIAAADAIIIAADKNVEMARFDGKPVIMVPVADGIHKAEELVNRAVSGTVPVYHHTGSEGVSSDSGNDSVGRTIYKHLMNGVSHMLPFVIGGGILIALAFLFDDYSIDPSNFGKNTPLAAYLKTIGEQAFGMMLPILAGFIAMSIADRPGLAVGLVAGMIAKMGATFANPAGGDVNAGFLGALFAGFVGGYIVVGLRKLFSKLPKSLEGIKPVLLYPVIGIFLAAVVTTFINPYMGMINDGLTHFLNGMGGASRIVLGMVLGGMMSIDMGGPFNKAAYVFGTAQLAEGNFEVMAAVMAGGMVPPIAIALCTTFFKKKFTAKDRQSGIVNYVMGLSFITEGAIPFAAQDPLRVIPSCIIGSALAGGLSMAFGCTLRAPHGGIFVLPTIGNPFMYLAAVVAGAAVGCVILGFLKKNVNE
ncbi:fructose-specific PTS transporter subunit EIIC [Lachnoclostridium pacaense]|uniref:PTS fructose transporter subunit IIABC n=1 Tax=Enterocloster hominis (ex Hitch et al. 2024) TaxID=1917870 RepID=UPI001D11173D|nr:fructose-specific PTS transporter subunit EIIC [Lachnoclostridium pacaense]MCC2876386.1 fructose-specific PTS transporter subunit EIIC [Lachnoclostridium pacaense]